MVRAVICGTLVAASGFAQTFEVASVKPGPPPGPGNSVTMGMRGGPGTNDPTRAVLDNLDLANLLTMAFATDRNHLSAPDWTMMQRFVIEAKLPEGSTRAEFSVMLKNLLIERFHLAYHMEKKESTTYDLVIAKNGPKFKEAPEDAAADIPPPRAGGPQLDAEGYPILSGGRGMMFVRGHARFHQDETLDQLAGLLSGQVSSPVTNATGLTGKYDVALQWVSQGLKENPDEPGPSIFEAVQEQLGLRLQAKKGTIDVFVVDHLDKTPTEN